MQSNTTREEFSKQASRMAQELAEQVWEEVVKTQQGIAEADTWMRNKGSRFLRKMLGEALTLRAERVGVGGRCPCGGSVEFRQRRPFQLHTVLSGRDVDVRVHYGQCSECGGGQTPLLNEMKVDREGFTQALQELSLLAGVIEPYQSASGELLRKFAGVVVSSEKIQSLVRQEGPKASDFMFQATDEVAEPPEQATQAPLYVEIDGGMIHVDKRWQEVKLACVFRGEDRVGEPGERGELTQRRVIAIRGKPDQLAEPLWPLAVSMGADHRNVVVLGDGARWIWNLAEMFSRRVEILDWYHADEHISHLARVLYGEATPEAERFRSVQLDRLENDQVAEVIQALRFLRKRIRSKDKCEEIDKLIGYLDRNRHRMMYKTFKELGYHIGSGAVESAIGYVVQQRMKRSGMRWHAAGADAMLALRSVYRSHGMWEDLSRFRAS